MEGERREKTVRWERQRRQVKWDAACMSLPWATGSQPHRIRGCKNSEAGNVFRDLYGKTLPTRAPVSRCAGAQTLVMWGTGWAPGNVSKLEGDHRVRWDGQVVCHPAPSPASTHSPSPRLSTLKGPSGHKHTQQLFQLPLASLPPRGSLGQFKLCVRRPNSFIREWLSEGHPTPATSPGSLWK